MPPPRHSSVTHFFSFQVRLSVVVLTLVAGLFYLHATTQHDIELENNFKATFQHLYIAEEAPTNKSNVEGTSKGIIPMHRDEGAATEHHQPNLEKQRHESQLSRYNGTAAAPSILKLHFTVSSDCSTYQRWQVLVQIHSAHAVSQAGRFSWLISGCSVKEEAKVLSAVADHFPDGSLMTHFTPDYSDMSKYGGKFADEKVKRTFLNRHGQLRRSPYGNRYMFNNKPNSVAHWAARTGPAVDEMVVLIDPDFLFMNQLVVHGSHDSGRGGKKAKRYRLGAGFPAAQNYGLGDQFLSFNLTRICGAGSPCTKITSKEVYDFYSAGPPYIIHATDLLGFATEWARLVPLTYDEYPMLYAEMFAYSMAAAQLNLKHALLHGLMTGCMVGWPRSDQTALNSSTNAFVNSDNSGDVAQLQQPPRGAPSCFQAPLSPPPFLHYCQHYFSGAGPSFGKRGVPHTVLECDSPPMAQKTLARSSPGANGKMHDAATGVKHNSNSLGWNALSYCAVTRGIDHARSELCSPGKRRAQ